MCRMRITEVRQQMAQLGCVVETQVPGCCGAVRGDTMDGTAALPVVLATRSVTASTFTAFVSCCPRGFRNTSPFYPLP
jgi:hypothetical protein